MQPTANSTADAKSQPEKNDSSKTGKKVTLGILIVAVVAALAFIAIYGFSASTFLGGAGNDEELRITYLYPTVVEATGDVRDSETFRISGTFQANAKVVLRDESTGDDHAPLNQTVTSDNIYFDWSVGNVGLFTVKVVQGSDSVAFDQDKIDITDEPRVIRDDRFIDLYINSAINVTEVFEIINVPDVLSAQFIDESGQQFPATVTKYNPLYDYYYVQSVDTLPVGTYELVFYDESGVVALTYPGSVNVVVPPYVSDVKPSAITLISDKEVNISGIGFDLVNSIDFVDTENPANVVSVSDFESESHDSLIQIEIPRGTEGGETFAPAIYAVVLNTGYQSIATDATLTVTDTDVPVVHNVSQLVLDQNATTEVSVAGINFDDAQYVVFENVDREPVASFNAIVEDNTSLSFSFDGTLDPGPYTLSVMDSQERSGVFKDPIIVSTNTSEKPTITEISPSSFNAGTRTLITVTGDHLTATFKGYLKDQGTGSETELWVSSETPDPTRIEVIVPLTMQPGTYSFYTLSYDGEVAFADQLVTIEGQAPTNPILSSVYPDYLQKERLGQSPMKLYFNAQGLDAQYRYELVNTDNFSRIQLDDITVEGDFLYSASLGLDKWPLALGVYDFEVLNGNAILAKIDDAIEVINNPTLTLTGETKYGFYEGYEDGTFKVQISERDYRPNMLTAGTIVLLSEDGIYYFAFDGMEMEDLPERKIALTDTIPLGLSAGTYDVLLVMSYDAQTSVALLEDGFQIRKGDVPTPVALSNQSDKKNATEIAAKWTLPFDSDPIEFYQYSVYEVVNGNEVVLRDWEDDKIQLAEEVTAGGFEFENGKLYRFKVRAVKKLNNVLVAGEPAQFDHQKETPDLNHDNLVNRDDYRIWRDNRGRTDKPNADINQDGRVNFGDLRIILQNWS